MKLIKVQIYILAKDRPEYLRESLDSVISQDKKNIELEIIVSDNSTSDDVQNIMNEYSDFKELKYIRRIPPMSLWNHIKKITSEINSEYVILFHDDDILLPNYLQSVTPVISQQPDLVAVGCNALIVKNKKDNVIRKSFKTNEIQEFASQKAFLESYIDLTGIAPFSSYIYRTQYLVEEEKASSERSGKYQDVMLLTNLIKHGKIIWLPQNLMYLRMHNHSLYSEEDVHDRVRLMRYMYQQGIDRRSQEMLLYKYVIYLRWIKNKPKKWISIVSNWRYRTIAKFLLNRSIKNLFNIYFWSILIKRIWR